MEAPWKAMIVGILCIATAASWKALLSISPIDPLPIELPPPPQRVGVFSHNDKLRSGFKLALGLVRGPEDLAVDSEGNLYTACADGWVKKISFINDFDVHVENWTYVGGRPLGVTLGIHGELLVCEPAQGLLNVTRGKVEVLSKEAEGLKYKLTDGVDVSKEGIIYFTDASHKYSFDLHELDIIEYRPNGRLLKFDPATRTTTVLLRDLYFANGVALSPKQDFLVFCESSMYRCGKYWLQGPKEGSVESFIDGLPGFPDNIRYDGEGTFWIALPTGWNPLGRRMIKYRFLRHVVVVLSSWVPRLINEGHVKGSSVLAVNENGDPLDLYSHPDVPMITTGLKVGTHLYFGGLHLGYVGRINL
uniref:Strictosidine synthase conserved region domain-containing protein n=1 Tax=Araucaria cunninghamii TaxID=56994 RepID=A0A0D6QRV5_ARACU